MWVLPKITLGWDALDWASANLLQPDGPHAGEPWQFTDEQARFLLHFYALTPQGEFVYRNATLRRLKGWGKDPLGAVICAIEFVGPCRFGGWESAWKPRVIDNPSAWVQTVGVAQEQTKNTTTLFPSLFSKKCIEEHHIDLGKTLIYAHRGARRIEAITSAAQTSEGNRPSFILQNETQHWTRATGGHDMADANRRNLAKSGGSARSLAITNAHNPGEDSVAEQDHDAYLAMITGRSKVTGILYDSLEAPPETDLADPKSLKAGLEAARGDSVWVNPDRLMQEIYDPRTPPSVARRFYLNQIVASEDAWIAPHEWERRARPNYTVADGSIITLGLDGSKSDDHTALVGCEVETSHMFLIGHWDPTQYIDGLLPRDQVDALVHQVFEKYDVVGFYSDRLHFETYIDKWAEEFGDRLCVSARVKQPVEWDMGARNHDATKATEAFLDAIVTGSMTHDGNAVFTQHVLNARNRPNNYGMSFAKESKFSSRKVDALAAAILARQARQDYLALPENKQRAKAKDWVLL